MKHLVLGLLTLATLLMLPVSGAFAQPNAAFESLRDAESFAPGGVSIDNHRSEQLSALDAVAGRGTPEVERLFREATTVEGKLYALLALHSLDRARFEALSRRLPRQGRVRMQSGCMSFVVDIDEALSEVSGPLTMFPRND